MNQGHARDTLIHVVDRLEVGGVYSLLENIPVVLPEYQHLVLHATPLAQLDPGVVSRLQELDHDVQHRGKITQELLWALKGKAAVLYNLEGPGYHYLGKAIPSLYYSYGVLDRGVMAGTIVACSEFASKTDRRGNAIACGDVLPPLVDVSLYRQTAGRGGDFTIGMISSGTYGQYPDELAQLLLSQGARLLLTPPPEPQGLRGLDGPGILSCSIVPRGDLRYIAQCDVLVQGTRAGHYAPYGRAVVEAMGMGKVVLCERRGIFPEVLQDKVNAILYDEIGEIPEILRWIQRDTAARQKLSANAQFWASRQDTRLIAGQWKRTLRKLLN